MKKSILFLMCSFVLSTIACGQSQQNHNSYEVNKMFITITNASNVTTKLSATLSSNSATNALISHLEKAPVTLQMQPYGGFEVYGKFNFSLPTEDVSITTKCGDIMLVWGNTLSINYGRNTYSFTPVAFLDDVKNGNLDSNGLQKILGSGNVSVTLSLN